MKNFRILLIHELRSQMKSFTFVVMIPVALVVSFLVTNLQVASYKDRRELFEEQYRQSQEQLNNIYFYSQLRVDVYMPPLPLSVFAGGLDERIGNKITVSPLDLLELSATSQRGNAFIKLFNKIDIMGIVRIMSIFIILMAASPIAQEREQQTGKLIFSNNVGKLEYYLSKYVALMTIAGIMSLLTFGVPALRMWLDSQMKLSLADTGSIVLMLLSSLLYLSVFVLISLSVSAASSKVSMATFASLMVWVLLTHVYPFTVNSVIDRLIKVPSDNSVTEQIEKIDRELEEKNILFALENDAQIDRGWCMVSEGNIPGSIAQYNLAERLYFEKAKKMNDYVLPNWIQRINQVESIKDGQKRSLFSSKVWYDRFTFFIPDRVYQYLCEQLAGTGYTFREKQFTEAAKNYRLILTSYIQSKNGFGYPYFTQIPESEMRDRYEEYLPAVVERYCNDENSVKINTADFPQFNMPHRSGDMVSWVGFILMNLIFGVLSLWIYNKHLPFK
jgi:ABC-type transport system involved in multi-copper enzyme maturation permease subunit